MRKVLLTLALAATTASLAAQTPAAAPAARMNRPARPAQAMAGGMDPMPASYRGVQLTMLKLQRKTLLAMADSMPETHYRERATPIQRSFAEQIQHAAGSAAMIAGAFTSATKATWTFADTAAANGTRAGLDAYINSAYDFAEARLAAQTSADRAAMMDVFGAKMEGWKVWDEIHEHTFWTAGQVVANFRMNGMAPPGFGFF